PGDPGQGGLSLDGHLEPVGNQGRRYGRPGRGGVARDAVRGGGQRRRQPPATRLGRAPRAVGDLLHLAPPPPLALTAWEADRTVPPRGGWGPERPAASRRCDSRPPMWP